MASPKLPFALPNNTKNKLTLVGYLQYMFGANAMLAPPKNPPVDATGKPVPYVIIESDRDNINTQLQDGVVQLRDEFIQVYLFSNTDRAYTDAIEYNIRKAVEVVNAHYGVDRFIKLHLASGCSKPIYRVDISRWYAVVRFRVHYLEL